MVAILARPPFGRDSLPPRLATALKASIAACAAHDPRCLFSRSSEREWEDGFIVNGLLEVDFITLQSSV